MSILDPKRLADGVDAAFLEPAPPIDVLVELGHAQLGAERQFACYIAQFADVADPEVFYVRALGLSWGDTYVERGRAFPGRDALTVEELGCSAYREIREDILRWSEPRDPSTASSSLHRILDSLCCSVDMTAVVPIVGVQQVVSEWNLQRFIWVTPTRWALAEWGTSA